MVAAEQLVKFRPVALCQAGCLGDIALGGLQELDEVLLFKLAFGFSQGHDFFLMMLDGVLEQFRTDQG